MTFPQFKQAYQRLYFIEREQLDAIFGRGVSQAEWDAWQQHPMGVVRTFDNARADRLWMIIEPSRHNTREVA